MISRRPRLKVGGFYEDCGYHPCLCTAIEGDEITGISLVDGSIPRSCSIARCAPRPITAKEAIALRLDGPSQECKDHIKSLEAVGWSFQKWWKD